MLNISLEKIFVLAVFWTFASMIFIFVFELIGKSVFSIVMAFYKHFLPKKYKEMLPLYEKCSEKFGDNEHRLLVALYPMSLLGRYFLPYILVLIYALECVFVFSVFQYSTIRSNEQLWYVLIMLLGILIIFMVLTFGILFYKKIQSSTSPKKKYQLIDEIAYILSFLLFVYEIYQLSLNKENVFSGFLKGISDNFFKINIMDRFLSILIILGLGYGHYKLYSFFEKYFEKKSETKIKKKKLK